MKEKKKIKKLVLRKRRTRSKVVGTSKKPRLSVYRSNRYISAQLIDDEKGITLVSVNEKEVKTKNQKSKDLLRGKVAIALSVGQELAAKALKKKIMTVVFDKGGRKYHGRVKQIAEGARKGGLKL